MAIVERHIITKLCGAHYTVCYDHHFTDPVIRMAFQHALKQVLEGVPGSQVYGATVLYEGTEAENYASLASYLLLDIFGAEIHSLGSSGDPGAGH